MGLVSDQEVVLTTDDWVVAQALWLLYFSLYYTPFLTRMSCDTKKALYKGRTKAMLFKNPWRERAAMQRGHYTR